MTHIDLFSGIGGFALAAQWNGFETILFCDNDKFCQKLLEGRFNGEVVANTAKFRPHNEKNQQELEEAGSNKLDIEQPRSVPIYGDIRDLDGTKYRGATLLTGGFPCQPFSQAGKRKGKEDDRYLWDEMFRVIREAQPKWVLAENVYGLLTIENGLVFNKVLSDLESVGYEVQPLIIPACAVNAPHRRDRVWIIAYRKGARTWSNEGGLRDKFIRESGRSATDSNASYALHEGHIRGSGGGEGNGNRFYQNKQTGQETRGTTARCDEITADSKHKGLEGRKDTCGGDCLIGNSEGTGQQGGFKRQKQGELWGTGAGQNWIKVAAEFCGVFNGVSDWLDRHLNRIIMEANYGKSIKGNKGKDLSCLRETLQQKEVWEKIRGFFTVFEQTDVLTILWKLQEATKEQDDIQFKGKESTEINGLRELWDNAQFRRSPHRRQYQEQLSGELKNIVPQLPHEVALEVAEIWDCLQCAYASMISPETHINDWVVSKSRHRVERLKSLGNAIVPQVAFQIIKAIVEVENDPFN